MAQSYQLPPWVLILVCHFSVHATAIRVCPLKENRKIIRINLNVPMEEHSLYFWNSGQDFEYTVQSPTFPNVLKKVLHIQEANSIQDDLGGWWHVFPGKKFLWDYCRMIVQEEHANTPWLCTSLNELYVTFPANVILGSDCKASGRASTKIMGFRLPMLCAALVVVALFGACRLLFSCRESCRSKSAEITGGEGGGGEGGGSGEGGPEGNDQTTSVSSNPASEIHVEDLPPSYDDLMRDVGATPPPYTSLKIENLPQTA